MHIPCHPSHRKNATRHTDWIWLMRHFKLHKSLLQIRSLKPGSLREGNLYRCLTSWWLTNRPHQFGIRTFNLPVVRQIPYPPQQKQTDTRIPSHYIFYKMQDVFNVAHTSWASNVNYMQIYHSQADIFLPQPSRYFEQQWLGISPGKHEPLTTYIERRYW